MGSDDDVMMFVRKRPTWDWTLYFPRFVKRYQRVYMSNVYVNSVSTLSLPEEGWWWCFERALTTRSTGKREERLQKMGLPKQRGALRNFLARKRSRRIGYKLRVRTRVQWEGGPLCVNPFCSQKKKQDDAGTFFPPGEAASLRWFHS